MRKVLVAGVGNIFFSDDGFGVEVVRQMAGVPLPEGVELVDFGIRGVHLAHQLLDGYDVLVLIDAAPRGRRPGTVSLLEVDEAASDAAAASTSAAIGAGEAPMFDVHGMAPGSILQMLGSLGGQVSKVLVVACEPESIEEGLGLTDVVRDAVPDAVALVRQVMDSDHVSTEEAAR